MAGGTDTTEVKGSYPVRCSHFLCAQSTRCEFLKNIALFYSWCSREMLIGITSQQLFTLQCLLY